jgi:site-specific DNA-methyltransferase (adenine-specific)
LLKGDCREQLKLIPDESVDSIVTDPPYELGFMGKSWDASGIAYNVEVWRECLRVLKPGGHLLAFGGSRTYHRLACAVEDAGFEIRDQIMWVYGSGFPKSLNVGKQEGCEDWDGWGTALKPAHEPVVVARKPLTGTVAQNVLRYGTGAINIDGCRVGDERVTINTFDNGAKPFGGAVGEPFTSRESEGRWPANFIHDGSDEVLELFPETKPGASAARFFYCAKASKAERNAGLEHTSTHPTVKPIDLMRYLIRLVTPPNGTVLDPFAGSGTTLVAAIHEHMNPIGIELTEEYWPIIEARTDHARNKT